MWHKQTPRVSDRIVQGHFINRPDASLTLWPFKFPLFCDSRILVNSHQFTLRDYSPFLNSVPEILMWAVLLLAEERHVFCPNRTGKSVCVCVVVVSCACVRARARVCVCVCVCYIQVRISGVRKYGVDNLSCTYTTHDPYHVMTLRGLTWDFM